MSFFWILLIIVPFYLELPTIQGSGGLYIVKNLPEIDGLSRLTCMSEDDGAALIWNYDLNNNITPDQLNYNEHDRRTTIVKQNCGIWRSWRHCMVSWGKIDNWALVDSIRKPMGPVVDHRWEGFTEYDFSRHIWRREFLLLELKSPDGMLVFSIRGKRDVRIHLCEDKYPTQYSCFLINIAVGGMHSSIETCLTDVLKDNQTIQTHTREIVANVTHKTAILDDYEWRTFRLQFTKDQNMIMLFSDTDETAFLQGHIQQWHSVDNILVESEAAVRMKLHYYYYFLTTTENAVITTQTFPQDNKNVCINMMVSLCPDCQLNISLINDKNDSALADTSNFGNDFFIINGLRIWRSVKLHTTLRSASSIRLQITAILNLKKMKNKDIWWAIDDLRLCEQTDGVVQLNTRTPIFDPIADSESKIKCQKLSYTKTIVVDLATSKSVGNENQLRQFIQEQAKSSALRRLTFHNINAEELSEGKSNFKLVAILIVGFCLLLLFGLYWQYGRAWMRSMNPRDILPVCILKCSNGTPSMTKRLTPREDIEKCQVYMEVKEPNPVPCQSESYPVSIKGLEEYVKEALASGLLETQWKMLPADLSRPYDNGYLPKNRPKNRCHNVIPYDDNRVILKRSLDDSCSDYINASYIKGHRKAKAYIATQGPKRDEETKTDTVPDFWRMVWQENVSVICMLTNVFEDGEKKCEQYWPEVGQSAEYGHAFVLTLDHQVSFYYTLRTLQLMCPEGKREIKHFHYTGWPDHGVPMFTQSLAAFMSKLLATPVGKGPMVVHGSAGIGRTGTFILCDICLRQAVEERVINIPAVTSRIRQDRANMVATMQQYLLAHLVIAECKILDRTQIPCTKQLTKKIFELRKQLPSDVERLKTIVWQDRALHSLATRVSIIPPNRFLRPIRCKEVDVAPDPYSSNKCKPAKFLLPGARDSRSNCLHAVSVAGIKRREEFLAIRLPSPSTSSHFWSLIIEKEIELIIILQPPNPEDETHCDIFHNKPGFISSSHIRLPAKSTFKAQEYFTTQKLLLVDSLQDEKCVQPITILTYKEWVNEQNETPPHVQALVSLWIASEQVQRKETPILVVCRNGVTGCGLYVALSFLLGWMALEKECDVISAVRAIQRSNPDFVQSLEQFEYLYDAALIYNTHFATYANFS